MKNLSLKNRLSPTLVGLLCGSALAVLPGVASAQLAESWENGVVAGKWVTSSGTNSYVVPDAANPPVLRSSITDEPAGAACAGRYLRETRAFSGGRTWSVGAAGVQPVTAGQQYCVSAWIRGAAGSQPFLAIHYTNNAGAPVGAFGTQECFIAGSMPFASPATCTNLTQAIIPTNGTWAWYARSFTAQPAGATHIVAKVVNFCGNGGDCVNQPTPLPPADFDDIRIAAGACPATAPADTAPHVACAANTPICAPGDAANNAKCLDCTGNAGAAAPARACPAATPVCVTAGATKGSCRTSCTSDFGGDGGAGSCPEASPFCTPIAGTNPALKECKACAGNNGSAATPACPSANPTCFTTGAKAGTCGKCTAQSDCGGTTPRCEIATGRCTDDCEADADCGDKKSGKICLASTLKCSDGCRGDLAGNGCPDGSKCSSVDLKPGLCTPTEQPDAGSGGGGTNPNDSGTTPGGGSGTGEPGTPGTAADDGGCSMSPRSAGGTATLFVGLGLALAAVSRRRRRD